jgi:hypothetical protein
MRESVGPARQVRVFALSCLLAIVAASGPLVGSSTAETLEVPGKANIFGAGHTKAPAPGGGGGGVLPPLSVFLPGRIRS